jgi:hypothetical protein
MHTGGFANWRTYDNYLRFYGVRIFGGFVWRSKSSKIKKMNQQFLS